MGAAAGGLSAVASIASSGLKVAGDLQQGQAGKLQGQLSALRLQTAAKAAEVRGDQVTASYDQNLRSSLANFDALTAASGVGIDSPTRLALAAKGEEMSEYQRQIGVSNAKIASLTAQGDAAMAMMAGKNAMAASYLKAATDGVQGVQGLYSLGKELF